VAREADAGVNNAAIVDATGIRGTEENCGS
jgi:hypothetical protein